MREIGAFSTAKNQNGQTIASRGSRLLCSPRDPEKESLIWLERQKLLEADKVIVVLGGGAGHHVMEILKSRPDMKLFVVELDHDTYEYCKKALPLSVNLISGLSAINIAEVDAVLSFRPAWVGHESKYLDMYNKLTKRDSISLKNFNLKDYEFSDSDDEQYWKTLRELIK